MITRAIFFDDQHQPRTLPSSRAVLRFTRPALLLPVLFVSALLISIACSSISAAEPESQTAAASSSATIKSLAVTPVLPNDENGAVPLTSRDERRQLHATAEMHNGRLIDYTRDVSWTVTPAGLAEIDQTGLLIPLQNGSGEILARTQFGVEARRPLQISGMDGSQAISFRHQIVPIFTKLNCNGGGCHGKASGQNGFRLSLLGFYPEDDYEFLVYESRGRRLFPAAPAQSLLLQKGTGAVPHGGGSPLIEGSDEYRLLYRWIEQGMPYGSADEPVITSIQCYPEQRILAQDVSQQLTVVATYSDGHTEDVTRMALYEPNVAEMAEVTPTGLVTTGQLSGEVAVMARYQGQVATFRATIPLGAAVNDLPPSQNFIDESVFKKLKELGIPASAVADDATFLRRVFLDITGQTPSAAQVRDFLADNSGDKRQRIIEDLLASPEYASFFANKWSLLLRNQKDRPEDELGVYLFYDWIRNSLYENKPYDEFVREVLTASGSIDQHPPVAWYREVTTTDALVEDTAQLFLGVRIQCARCHHHPFEKWSQDDYYGMAAFFSRIGKKQLTGNVSTRNRERRVYHNPGTATAVNPKSGNRMVPAGLGGKPLEIPASSDPRVALADWMAETDNPFFARTLVNRYWKHFFGRGLVDPEDDMRATNPPANPELLDQLAEHFVKTDYDLKELVRVICNSSTYQLSSEPNEYNVQDRQNFSRYYPKRLGAETLYDALHRVTGTETNLPGLPAGYSALQMRDVSQAPYFMKVFGQPQADTACECERSQDASLAQSLHLLNSSDVQKKIAAAEGRAAKLAGDAERPENEKIQELYLWAFGRPPAESELQTAVAYVSREQADKKNSYEDVIWALLNSKEFLFNH